MNRNKITYLLPVIYNHFLVCLYMSTHSFLNLRCEFDSRRGYFSYRLKRALSCILALRFRFPGKEQVDEAAKDSQKHDQNNTDDTIIV